MRAGPLRYRVSLDGPPVVRTGDGDGGYTEALTALTPREVYAAIEPLTAAKAERVVSNTVAASVSHLVRMRYHPGVTTQTQITFGTRTLYVRGIQNVDELNVELRLACEEVVS